MKSLNVIYAILIILILSSLPGMAASSAVLQVSATIRPWVTFKAVQHLYSYRVTAADLQRGYIDLDRSITLEIKTNIRRDIPVKFSSDSGDKILFRDSEGGIFFENEYTLYPDRRSPAEAISRKIDSRIMLTANSKEGVYPLSVSMSPEI